MANSTVPIIAAGGVLWRPSRKHGVKVGLIHRPRYDDWSLPKGKAELGETVCVTAAREISEETGLDIALGRRLTSVTYPVGGRKKVVHYFASRVLGGKFAPNREVDNLEWHSISKAHERLTHHYDRTVLDSFTVLPADLSTIVLVRHAHAGHHDSFAGADHQRPLTAKGWRQAADLASQLATFRPAVIGAAPLTRCEQTVQPLASHLRTTIAAEPLLSEVSYAHDPAAARRRILEYATSADLVGAAVISSQGGVIPGLVKALAARAELELPTTTTPKAAYWVLSLAGKRLRQADRYLPD